MAQNPFGRNQPTDGADFPPPSPDDRPVGVVPVVDARTPARSRTWSQRAVLGFNSVVSLGLLASAGTVWYANHQLGNRKLVEIVSPQATPSPTETVPPLPGQTTIQDSPEATTESTESTISFPVGSTKAANFLLTASDSRACIDPNSPYAGAFGSANDVGGERADTIMLLRVDPGVNQAAILSFPRDLWVKIPGRGSNRINVALDKQNPQKIVDTIYANFGLVVDHYINVDFCAFKSMVEAVGGVPVPFEFAARDRNTGLNVEAPGCRSLAGDEALAYVRSRHYQYFDPQKNKWVSDGTSDLGRITRQQDFLKRTLQKALTQGARNPVTAQKLLTAALKYVITDRNLTVDVALQLAGAMRDFNPDTVKTFQVESTGMKQGNASVLKPQLGSKNMKNVLAVFSGKAAILDLPVGLDPSLADTTTTTVLATTLTTLAAGGTPTSKPLDTTTTVAAPPTSYVAVREDRVGIAPPIDPTCK